MEGKVRGRKGNKREASGLLVSQQPKKKKKTKVMSHHLIRGRKEMKEEEVK